MKITEQLHLCYSLNVYSGSSLEEKLDIFENKIPIIRNKLGNSSPFAVGFWLDSITAQNMDSNSIKSLKSYMEKNKLYTFTANAFPYGIFHNDNVKTGVYAPDWTTDERTTYTCKVANILSQLLPYDITGSISTLPGSYSEWIKSNSEVKLIADNLLKTARHLTEIESQTGKRILLAIEMEPDCLWESPEQFIDFFDEYIRPEKALSEYIGVCYDTCHQELLNNSPGSGLKMLIDAGISIAKIQLSAAISAPENKKFLAETFNDSVYLHQTRSIGFDGLLTKFTDMPEAVEGNCCSNPWIVHYHVPIYCEDIGGNLTAAKDELIATINFIKQNPNICSNIEIETYTYSVLPEHLKPESIEKSIAMEYEWLINKLR